MCSLRPSAIFLTWRFPGSRSCTDAVTTESITEVEVTLDGANPSSQSCADGLAGGFNGILLDNVTPGTHVIRLRAFGASRFQYFEAASTVQVVANDTFSATLDFTYVVGGYPLKWRFLNAGVERSCAQLGSPQVYLNFRDRDGGGFIYPGAGVDVPCVSAGQVQGAVFPYFPRGSFDVFVQAVGPSSTLYRSDQLNPPRATVVAGVFPPLDAGVVFTAVYP